MAKTNKIENKSNSVVEARVIQPNSFINGDCMEFMRTCPPNFFDLAIVDPPYGIDVTKLKIRANKKDKHWDASPPASEYFEHLFRISKNQIIWGMNFLNDYLPKCEKTVIWDKQNDGAYGSDYELAWTSFEGAKQEIFRLMWYGYFYPKEELPLLHPTQKPIALYRWLIKKFGRAGDLILDTHVGSASSLIACVELGFDYVGFEIDKEYYTMAKSRLGRATRKYELFEAV